MGKAFLYGVGKSPKLEDKTVPLSMSEGDQEITPSSGYDGLSRATVQKPATLTPSNIKSGVTIGGVVGNYAVPLEAQKTVALDMASGDQTITPTSGYDGMEEVVVEKPATLLAENIKDGVTIGGVTGSYTAPAPTLITKSITQNGTYNASSDNADGYSQVTVNVSATPAEPVSEKDVNFYDYDGALVASYTAADFANLSAMPSNPSHTGLTAQGWNWQLAAAKTYVASYGKLNIGQMYATASGKTEYDIEVNEASGMTATLGLSGTEKDWGDGTTDTLETHTYSNAGYYTIKLSGTTLPRISESKKVSFVRIASGVTSIGSNAFLNCRSLQFVTIPSEVTSITTGAFSSCNALQSVTIPSGVPYFFGVGYCYALQSVTMPSSVTSTSSTPFQSCYALQSVTIPSGVTSIGSFAFSSCSSLQSVTIPSGVTSIGTYAFSSCSSLQYVTMPSSVTSIGSNAFLSCSWLTIMTVLATTPPTLSATNAIPSNVTKIYIPNGTRAAYRTASNWSSFASKFVELPA